MEIIIENINELSKLANDILKFAKNRKIFIFSGELGAGKTTIIKEFCNLLGCKENEITSPTFTIMNKYIAENNIKIYHFDFYRIKNVQELLEIGAFDYLNGDEYCFVEWPEIIMDYLEKQDVVKIKITKNIENKDIRQFSVI